MSDLTGSVVLVTGAARGIGAAIARTALRAGARVALLDRDACDEACADLPAAVLGRAMPLRADVTDEGAVGMAVGAIEQRWGPVTGLVNNAGIGAHHDPVSCDGATWDAVLGVDLRGAWHCARRALPGMRERGQGSIVNVSSIHAQQTAPGYFPYPVAKAGLEGMTRAIAVEEGPHGVRVNTVAPGWTATRLVQEQFDKATDPVAERARIVRAHPLRRIVSPDEVAAVTVFLLSSAASGVTGARLLVDAGLSARFAV